jgi:hypothetical protein
MAASGLDGGGSFLEGGKGFFTASRRGSGAHSTSYPIRSEAFPLRTKQPGREADSSPPSSAEIKNGGAVPPLSHTTS